MKNRKTSLLFLWLLLAFLPNISTTQTQSSNLYSQIETSQVVIDNKGFAMVYVPSGNLFIGTTVEEAVQLCNQLTSVEQAERACNSESMIDNRFITPSQLVEFGGFYIDQYEVSVGAYLRCIDADICSRIQRDQEIALREEGLENELELPITRVSYYDAAVFCAWREARLPTEAEWEYAARGSDGLTFPWGNEFDGSMVNFCDQGCLIAQNQEWSDGYIELAPVDSFPDGASWVGALNMAGNVSEWTSTLLRPEDIRDQRIVKGGSFQSPAHWVATYMGLAFDAIERRSNIGFRCLRTTAP